MPGILYSHVKDATPFFVLLTTGGFVLLSLKYIEISWRNPEGGVDSVIIGASRRSAFYHMLRGHVVKGLDEEAAAHLPPHDQQLIHPGRKPG